MAAPQFSRGFATTSVNDNKLHKISSTLIDVIMSMFDFEILPCSLISKSFIFFLILFSGDAMEVTVAAAQTGFFFEVAVLQAIII